MVSFFLIHLVNPLKKQKKKKKGKIRNYEKKKRQKTFELCLQIRFQRHGRHIGLHQRSPTGGPRKKFGGPWRNLDIICNFYVYYTYFKQAATNITLIILV
jgi:hypothetical protein